MRPILTGKQSQCPICSRIFTTDPNCERHKPYSRPVTPECKDPSEIGMVSRVRSDGFEMWETPMDPEARAKLQKMWAARRKENT